MECNNPEYQDTVRKIALNTVSNNSYNRRSETEEEKNWRVSNIRESWLSRRYETRPLRS